MVSLCAGNVLPADCQGLLQLPALDSLAPAHLYRRRLVENMPGPGNVLPAELVDGEGVGRHHDDHGNIEGQERAEDKEMLVVHLAAVRPRHEVLDVKQGENGDGGGQQEAQAPSQHYLHPHTYKPYKNLSENLVINGQKLWRRKLCVSTLFGLRLWFFSRKICKFANFLKIKNWVYWVNLTILAL